MKLKFGKRKHWIIALCGILLIVVFLIWENNSLMVDNIEVCSEKIPEEFNDYRIVQISDLHSKEFGHNQQRLIKKLKSTEPDSIVITGDLIDSGDSDIRHAMEFIKQSVKIASVYYVTGNHENWSDLYPQLKKEMQEAGVVILENIKYELKQGNAIIELIGVPDATFMQKDTYDASNLDKMDRTLDDIIETNSNYKILLSHRPELFDVYCEHGVNLVFTGHAHGGQFRIPLIGGLIAPDQGLFPKYTAGVHTKQDTTMVISRGLGNSVIPVRIFNRPELVVVTLQSK